MPCDSVTTVGLNLKGANKDWIISALKALGYETEEQKSSISFFKSCYNRGTFNLSSGEFNVTSQSKAESVKIGSEINQAYSMEIVNSMAKDYGWEETSETDQQTEVIPSW